MTNEIHLSEEDSDEIKTFVQLGRIEGGTDLIQEIVQECITQSQAHVVEATIDLSNKEAYVQILEEETRNE